MRRTLGTILRLADQGLLNRADNRPRCDVQADAVIDWLERHGVALKWDEADEQTDYIREQQAGKMLMSKARALGWLDDGEGAYEFVTRKHYESGLEYSKCP